VRRALTVLLAIVTSFVSVTVLAAPAGAYTFLNYSSCRYDPANDADGLGIGIDSTATTAEHNATVSAGGRWSVSGFEADFTYIGSNLGASKVDLRVTWANLGATIQAKTYYWCSSLAAHYTQDPVIKWGRNQSAYPWTTNNRIAVGVHEIGHSIGLDHNTNTSCNGAIAGLMYNDAIGKYNACGWTSPTADDVTGANDVHW